MFLNDQKMAADSRALSYDTFSPFKVVAAFRATLPLAFTSNLPPNIEVIQASDSTQFNDLLVRGVALSGLGFQSLDMVAPPYLRYILHYTKARSDSLIITQNLIDNILLNSIRSSFYNRSNPQSSPNSAAFDAPIRIAIHPLPELKTEKSSELSVLSDLKNFDLVFSLLLGVMFVVMQNSEELIRERNSKIKYLLTISRVKTFNYFLSRLAVDWVILFAGLFVSMCAYIGWSPTYQYASFVLPFIPLAMLYIADLQLLNYSMSYAFANAETSTRWMQLINMAYLLATVSTYYISLSVYRIYSVLALYLSPFAAFAAGVRVVSLLAQDFSTLEMFASMEYILALCALISHFVVSISALVWIEHAHSKVDRPSGSEIRITSDSDDADVLVEKARMQSQRKHRNPNIGGLSDKTDGNGGSLIIDDEDEEEGEAMVHLESGRLFSKNGNIPTPPVDAVTIYNVQKRYFTPF